MHTNQPAHPRRRSVIHRLVRIGVRIVLTIIIILVIVIFLVQTPYVQNIVRGKAEKYLSRKFHTRVNIGHLDITFFRSVELKDIYIEDRAKDTLLSAGLVHVDIRMWGLLHNNIDIRSIQLSNLTAKVKRQLPDTAFNFQFIVDAFAGTPDTASAKTPSTPMKIALRSLLLDKIRLLYKDTVTGNDMEVWIDHSQTEMKEFDPVALRFNVSSFRIKGLQARIWQGQPLIAPASGPAATATPLQLQLGKIEVESSALDYRSTPSALYANLQLGHLTTEVQVFDLAKEVITLKELNLDSSTTALRLGKTPPVVPAKASSGPAAAPGWHFTLAALRLNGDNLQFDDDNQRRQPEGMDYAHLNIRQLTLHGAGLSYSADSTSGALTKGSFTEQSGFRLTRLQTRFLYSNHQAWLQDLFLQTPGTTLQRSAIIKYASLTGMMKDPAHTIIDLDLPNSKIQVKDILTFVPSLKTQPVFAHPGDTWSINARLKGNLDALYIQNLQFSGIKDLRLDLAGTVLHPLDAKRITANLDLRHLSGSRHALVALLPKGALPSNISIPAHFDLMGKLNGGMEGFQSDLVLNTSSGTILLKGFVRHFRQPQQATYDLVLQTKALDLGYILQDSVQYGHLTAGFTAKGQGLDLNSANAVFSGRIAAATLRQYTYHGLSIDGSIAGKKAQLRSSINNTAVHFELQAAADLARKFPALKLDWQVDTLDLHALHLVKDTLQFKGHLTADFADTNPDSLQGNLKLANLVLVQGTQRFTTDSIALLASRQNDLEDIQLHSEMADLDMNGRYKLTEVAQALQHTISQYYRLDGSGAASDSATASRSTATADSTQVTRASQPLPGSAAPTFASQDWQLRGNLRPSPLVLAYMPSLKGSDSLGLFLAFNSDRNDLHLQLKDPHVQLGSQSLQQVNITAGTGNDQLSYSVRIDGGSGSGFELHKTSLTGAIHDNKLFTDLLLKDIKGKERYRLAGELDKLTNGLKFMLNPDSLLLNYDAWQVARDNYFQYDSSGIVIHNFTISHADQSLSVNSNPPAATSPVDLTFKNFQMNTLSRFADQDSLGVDGLLNGTAQVKNIMSSPVFTSDLLIKDLSYKKDTVGDLAVKVNNKKANAFTADISLKGKNNDIGLSGDYHTGDSSRMDLKLDLRQINLAAFNKAAEGVIDNMTGFLKGEFVITGTPAKPNLRGNLYFDSSIITPTMSGEALTVSKSRIAFDADGFNFSQFTLLDSAGNKLVLDGNVFTKDYRSYAFDLSLNAQNFRMINAPESSTREFYGQMNLDAAINLEGKMDAPKIDGDIRVNKNTNFYYVLPGGDPEVSDRLGVVRFVDHRTGDTLIDHKALALHAKKTEIKGLDVSLNLLTDTSAVLNVVIDPRSGDALNVRGRSTLVFQLEKSGKMDLTGSYEVNGGYYSLSFNVLKRKFVIDPGSVITWTGDPTLANVNLSASYTALTPSVDLVSNVIANYPKTDQAKFQQKLPFLVTLKMQGDLLKPTITFDVSLPTTVLTLWPDVDQRLTQLRSQQSEMNEQVFALLLLGRFVGADPFTSAAGGGSTVGNLAFSSASQILTSQIDQLAASLIKGVDIHFDLNNQQDFYTGTEISYTELDVTVAKSLMQDRLRVSVGSSFDVEGKGAPGQTPSNLAGNVEGAYKLSKDGRYLLRAYRQNQYEAVVRMQVVETGVGFVFTFNYDRFKEIWHRAKGDTIQARKTTNTSTTSP